MNRKDVCPGEIDFYVLRSLRNDALKGREETIKDVKREILSADDMSTIRNCEYVRTTRTAIARDVIKEELWVI